MELNRLVFSFFNAAVASRYWLDIVHGMWVTTYLAAAVVLAGLGAGLALAMARSFHFKPASFLIVVFADAFRALPPLVVIIVLFFAFPYVGLAMNAFTATWLALSLVLGGALGNAICRLLRGYVIDFIDWHWFDPFWQRPSLHWPTFNVADSAITVGLLMLLLEMVFARKPAREAGKPSA